MDSGDVDHLEGNAEGEGVGGLGGLGGVAAGMVHALAGGGGGGEHEHDLHALGAEPHELHDRLSAHHVHLEPHHLPHAEGHGTGIIWLLVLAHVAFVVYWMVYYYRQRQRMVPGKREPERVNCVYEFAERLELPRIELPRMPGLGQLVGDHKIP